MSAPSTNGDQQYATNTNQKRNGSPFRHNDSSHNNNNNLWNDGNDDDATTTQPLSNSALEAKARQLREQSASHSQILTQKLASSQSGQNLLHMGTSLSTLPPDLHLLLQNLHPILSATETTEKQQRAQLEQIVQTRREICHQEQRCQQAEAAAEIYQDLVAAERTVRRDLNWRRYGSMDPDRKKSEEDDESEDEEEDELDHAASLERAAHVALMLLEELETAQQILASATAPQQQQQQQQLMMHDTEYAQFLVKLAPRIRRLESDAAQCLGKRMELVLKRLQEQGEQPNSVMGSNSNNNNGSRAAAADDHGPPKEVLLVMGHAMRGLALLGRARDVESTFARTAIMPLVRSKVSMGRLDEGGPRGECAGLSNLLQDMVSEIAATYSPVLRLAESMFAVRDSNSDGTNMRMDVDLLTEGVWVPIVAALMADTGIKMAVFSPGIASILQANYIALEKFLAVLAARLLISSDEGSKGDDDDLHKPKYYQPSLSAERIHQAQDRVYTHPKTAEFAKKWNLPIYYQLRFGECSTRMNKAIDQTKREGWIANVFSGPEETIEKLRQSLGFELPLFIELYDILLSLWLPDVILRPLTNRFLRGAVQVVGRVLAFISDGLEGKILFGEDPVTEPSSAENGADTQQLLPPPPPSFPTRQPYCWGESEEDVAAVAWELTLLDSAIRHEYANAVCEALAEEKSSEEEETELKSLVMAVLKEASDQIHPLIDKAWNLVIVNLLTQKCSAPLAAVKGVAATYRMTNRPPPKQASPFVGMILRPIQEFDKEFANRTPDRIGSQWKHQIVVTVADRYAAAVEDLIATVQRTEVALKNRKARRTAAGGMSDGEKVKLQLYLDYQAFFESVREVGVEPASVIGLSKLGGLTAEGEKLLKGDTSIDSSQLNGA